MPCLELGWKTGLEPATLGITIRCSNQLSYIHQCKTTLPSPPIPPGAPGRTRTCNRRLRRPVLYPVELRAPAGMIPAGARRIHAGCSAGEKRPGRGRGIRTHDIQLPKLALYQAELYPGGEARRPNQRAAGVSLYGRRGCRRNAPYAPSSDEKGCRSTLFRIVARPERFELPTTKFVAWCSIQLSYGRAEAKLWGTAVKASILS